MCVDCTARRIDSAAAGSALRAVYAAVLQPAADAAAVISTAADIRVHSQPAEPVTNPHRTTTTPAVVSGFTWQREWHTARDERHRVT